MINISRKTIKQLLLTVVQNMFILHSMEKIDGAAEATSRASLSQHFHERTERSLTTNFRRLPYTLEKKC